MSSIPSELYDRVLELATDLTNASESGDDDVYGVKFRELRALYEDREKQHCPHPFLTEALADYTDDLNQSAALYLLALEQAGAFSEEPTYTKHISLAGALISLGDPKQARRHLEQGQREARSAGDKFWVDEAAALARSLVT